MITDGNIVDAAKDFAIRKYSEDKRYETLKLLCASDFRNGARWATEQNKPEVEAFQEEIIALKECLRNVIKKINKREPSRNRTSLC